jgi:uncharacterized protein
MNMTLPTITLVTASCCALLQFALTVGVIVLRVRTGVLFMDGGDKQLMRRIRAHANLAETAPIVLLLMALHEVSGASAAALSVAGASFFVGRCVHACGITLRGWFWARQVGMFITLFVMSGLAGYGLMRVL